ncbi:hypothetical protein T310_2109 [Rasamsonia emersonii CBS 393.64]|uniref:Uncharacterized protein n=1 Tax=Rasamsonia emersonii (strain ATCC 16479 / CBS 393.64 / IMI 116815) TaxID=1408163 RepID=A0A0F4Z1Y8_RASE3|nr:hypothetical protein T310_2109 [Rasamsonia emersonii CBS 393.64]KKA23878.1 hypothetical protein T310_2109 [Rasamsonia emersonii CBS 393.64]
MPTGISNTNHPNNNQIVVNSLLDDGNHQQDGTACNEAESPSIAGMGLHHWMSAILGIDVAVFVSVHDRHVRPPTSHTVEPSGTCLDQSSSRMGEPRQGLSIEIELSLDRDRVPLCCQSRSRPKATNSGQGHWILELVSRVVSGRVYGTECCTIVTIGLWADLDHQS